MHFSVVGGGGDMFTDMHVDSMWPPGQSNAYF